MTALELLRQVENIEQKLRNARNKEERYRCATERITASLGSEQVSHSRNVSSMEDAIIRYMEARDAANQLEMEKNHVIDNVEDYIYQLSDDTNIQILVRHYIQHKQLKDIAKQLFLAPRTVVRRRRQAVADLDQLLQKSCP